MVMFLQAALVAIVCISLFFLCKLLNATIRQAEAEAREAEARAQLAEMQVERLRNPPAPPPIIKRRKIKKTGIIPLPEMAPIGANGQTRQTVAL